jgi:mannose-6-phosphate isomerase-like protein (cupin superfamily)
MATTGFTIKHLDELERPWPKWSLARRSLGINSFGMNVCHLEPGEDIPEHDETGRDQEEVFIVLRGGPAIVIEGEEHPVREGSFVRVDPELRRTVRNIGDEPSTVLIVSAPRSSGYQPPEWA